MSMQMHPGLKSVRVDGARLAYLESGPRDGEAVVLVHGYPANHRSWRHQIPALAHHHRVLAVDLIGWGESERPRSLGFDYDTEVGRLGRALDALGLERVNLFRHDYGGFLSLGFAQRHPERLDNCVGWMADRQGARWLLHFFADYSVRRRPELRDGLSRIACPTAVIWGRRDAYLRTAIAEELARSIPNCELTMVDDAGLFVMEERPAAVTGALLRVLER